MTTGVIALISVCSAFVIANAVKAVIELIKGNRNCRSLISSGGMPSVHTASAASLAISIGIGDGFDSAIFVLTLVFLVIVAYDATHVRRATGEQGEALNKILPKNMKQPYNSAGHSYIEVIAGCMVGVLVGGLISLLFA